MHIEKHFAPVYSAKIFSIVQEEIKGACFSCRTYPMVVDGNEVHRIVDELNMMFEVVYDVVSEDYSCGC